MLRIEQFAFDNPTISKVNINAEFQMQVPTGNGIDLIKKAIAASIKLRKAKGISIKFSYSGAPIYRCELEAKDYPSAENHLTKLKKKMESIIGSNGTVEMIRV